MREILITYRLVKLLFAVGSSHEVKMGDSAYVRGCHRIAVKPSSNLLMERAKEEMMSYSLYCIGGGPQTEGLKVYISP